MKENMVLILRIVMLVIKFKYGQNLATENVLRIVCCRVKMDVVPMNGTPENEISAKISIL